MLFYNFFIKLYENDKKKTESGSVYLKWPFKSHICSFLHFIFLLCRNKIIYARNAGKKGERM